MKKTRDQVRGHCPDCGLSKLMSYAEWSAHYHRCRVAPIAREDERRRPGRRRRGSRATAT